MVLVTLAKPPGLGIDQQRLVVTALDLPFLDRLRRHALDTKLHARHVVRRVDDEEQREGEEIHPRSGSGWHTAGGGRCRQAQADYAKSRRRMNTNSTTIASAQAATA